MVTTAAEPDAPDRTSAPPDRSPAPPCQEPIRAELYGLEHLEAHARALRHPSLPAVRGAPRDALLRRFRENGRALTRAHAEIAATAHQETLGADAEWLLDNYHIIEETLREVRHDLPRGFYHELPKVADGPYRGLPRVYALSMELIAHTDSSLDETNITRFVQAYQSHTPLTIGELWAVPIMLRVGLLENLRRLAARMLHTRAERQKAVRWADYLLARPQVANRAGPEPWPCGPAGWTEPCLVRVLQALRDRGLEASAAVEWLEESLVRGGQAAADVLRRENGRQAANQVTVGNCVTSLRLLGNLDWGAFFDRTSAVEALLRTDSAGVYGRQEFATRDRYRRAVERLARGSRRAEPDVARLALALSLRAAPAEVRRHVGYYLVGAGRPEFEAALGYRPRLKARFVSALRRRPNAVYFGSLLAVTALLLAGALACAHWAGASAAGLALAAAAALLPLSEVAVGLVHYVLTLLLPPRVLPKMDFKDGIPEDCSTFVVMPTLLTGPHSAAELTDHLEVHYLSNPDPQLRFALLTDFADAPTETRPGDEALLRDALDRVRALNERYAEGGPDRFYLFHRRRVWNPSQQRWMGWERKRGKLSEFNRLLRGATDTTYSVQSGDLGRLPRTRFVITLDADTRLPRESARRLVATLAHPLNRPHFDPARGRVVSGYGVLQPRVSFDLLAAGRSLFSRILTGSAGLDPYTTAVSDVYMDLFGRGSFTGKGIYEVDAFEAAVGRTFPDNRILSHDLIEGNYARCGLVTDIELLDEFPARYHAYARREHRWVRGDWQLLPWLFRYPPARREPAAGAGALENPRQPAAQPGPAGAARPVRAGVDRPPRCALGVDRPGAAGPRAAAVVAAARRRPRAGARRVVAAPAPRPALQSRRHGGAVLPQRRLPRRAGADGPRRHRPHALPPRRLAEEPARMGGGGGDGAAAGQRGGPFRVVHVAGVCAGRRAGRAGVLRPAGGAAGRGAAAVGVAAVAGRRLVGQPAARGARGAAEQRRARDAAPGGAQDVALLRDVRRPRRPLAAAGQLPGGPRRPRGAPHLADQRGAVPGVHADGPRPGLHQPGVTGRAPGEDL
jgi:cyclic beta-1,2-glucan synthetase